MDTYTLPRLGYAYNALEPLYDAETVELHHSAHHAGYVEQANITLQDLQSARRDNDHCAVNGLLRNLSFNVAGHAMHSLFWKSMRPSGTDGPSGALKFALQRDLDGIDAFREQFFAASTELQGSGWVALALEPQTGRLIVQQLHDHDAIHIPEVNLLMTIDLWEHAFYLKYRNRKSRWIKAFWDLIDWREMSQRYDAASPVRSKFNERETS